MPRSLRIPGLVDVLRSDDPAVIRALADDPRLDRHYAAEGPLANRLIVRRIRRVLQLDGRPLPPVAPRDADGRAIARERLEAELPAARAAADTDAIDRLARLVRAGANAESLGPAAQTVIGRLFVGSYQGTAETWEAAKLLDAAVRTVNPLRSLVWLLTGAVARARTTLAAAVGGNPSGLHATGIAVHNLVGSLARMAALAAQPGAFARLSPAAAASMCLVAPRQVLRQATRGGTTADGEFRRGTLVAFRLEAAHDRTLSTGIAFMAGSWSACPAHAWVPELLGAVWARAGAPSTAAAPP